MSFCVHTLPDLFTSSIFAIHINYIEHTHSDICRLHFFIYIYIYIYIDMYIYICKYVYIYICIYHITYDIYRYAYRYQILTFGKT